MLSNLSYGENMETFHVVNSTVPESRIDNDIIISGELREWINRIVYLMMLVINLIGLVTNAINIRVFINQGLAGKTANIAFLSLAIADIGSNLSSLPNAICNIISFIDLPVVYQTCYTFHLIVAAQARLLLSNVTCWLTVYISLERSLSVIIPLQVRRIFTPRTTIFSIIAIYACISLIHLSRPLPTWRWIFSPKINQTVPVIYASPAALRAILVLSLIFNTITPSFLIVFFTISLSLMIYKLKSHSKFRHTVTSSNNVDPRACKTEQSRRIRESEILKAIALVSGVFLACKLVTYIPGLVIALVPRKNRPITNDNLVNVSYLSRSLFDSVNSSVNMFIYLTVSSKYREAFDRVFSRWKRL